jgi:hypothetical protein
MDRELSEVTSLFSIVLALLIVSTRFAIHWREMGRDGFDIWSILVLLVLGIIFCHAVRRMLLSLRTASGDSATGTRQIACVWCGLTLGAIALWPWGAHPNQFSFATWAWMVVLLGFPLTLVDDLPQNEPLRGRVNLYLRVIIGVSIVSAIVSTVSYLQVVRYSIGSVDFFYYICCSRDMLTRPDGVSEMCYIYFPGVYAFWRAVMHSFGMELASLQNAYLTLIATNAIAVGGIVLRVARAPLGALVAALWYLVMSSRFEGMAGVTEPLTTLPFLIGLFIWCGRPLRGRHALLVAALFGASLGLAVYTKQQGGTLALGFFGLLVARPAVPKDRQHGWRELAVIPITAIVVFLVAVLLEGRGWMPLERGLGWALAYQAEGSWLRNLYTQVRGDESAALAALLAVVVWVALLVGAKRNYWAQRDAFQLVSFVIVAGLATLLQFRTRPYGHYMLLAVPCVVLAVSLLCLLVLPSTLDRFGRRPLARFLLLSAIAIPFVNTAGREDTLYVWRISSTASDVPRPQWHAQLSVRSDLEKLKEVIPPRTVMFHVPPRHNSLYYLLETYSASPFGYVYFPPDLEEIAWDECEHVICLRGALDETDREYWSTWGSEDEIDRLLKAKGFHRANNVRLETMELFRKNHDAEE